MCNSVNIQLNCHPTIPSSHVFHPPLCLSKLHVTHGLSLTYAVTMLSCVILCCVALDGGEWSTSHPSPFTPEEKSPVTSGPQSWSGHCGKEKNPTLPGIKP
jgi:hypothetical protein